MTRLLETRHFFAVQNLRIATEFYMNVLGFTRDFGECAGEPPASALGDHSYVAYVTADDVDAIYAEFLATFGAETDSRLGALI